MDTPNELYVHFSDQLVGTIRLERERMRFTYSPDWTTSRDAFPISLSLPLSADATDVDLDTSHNFFANLLPEATVRQRVCAKLKISIGNGFGLLAAIGGDCAGALTIRADATPPQQSAEYRPIPSEQLDAWSSGRTMAFSDVTGQDGVRLSLAGAQDKLPVLVTEDDDFLLPESNSPSTHLLKFTSPFYSHLPENETFTTMLAEAVGLPVVKIRLHTVKADAMAVIDRYDRIKKGSVWERLHQEDTCQVMGISPLSKYEKEGGPSLADVATMLRKHCSIPALEIDKLIDWSIFNLLVGNSDAHGKNLSILLLPGGQITLAPFYDLVCTRNYDNLDRHLAMSIGGEYDPGQVGLKQFESMAEELAVRESLILSTVEKMGRNLTKQMPKVIESFRARYGDSPILERIPIKVTQQVRRTATMTQK
ncbi:MAG: type II toxin-antitoxin system HipA family toxin [Planctomycetota bacterium]